MKHSKRKAEIYEVAISLFREKGYAAASMRDIAERVGIEASSLYSHISSKEQILLDVCLTCSGLFEQGMESVLASEKSYLEKVLDLVQLHIHVAIHHPGSVTVFSDEWKHLPEQSLMPFLESRRQYEKQFRNLIREGIAAGAFLPRSSKVLFNIIINSTKWLHYLPKKLSEQEVNDLQVDIFSFLEAGLTHRDGTSTQAY